MGAAHYFGWRRIDTEGDIMQEPLAAEDLLSYMPGVAKWEQTLRELRLAWRLIESTARMVCPVEAETILPTVRTTREGFNVLETQLVTNLVHENTAKCTHELQFKAQVTIDIVVRNLFERTADIGFLAMDDAIRAFVLDPARDPQLILPRLREYRDKYTVYDEILILDSAGAVLAHLDTASEVSHSSDELLAQTLASDSYVETFRRSDLRPGHDDSLIYSRRITDPASGQPIGVLCLCFPLAVEMDGVFAGLRTGADRSVMLMLDRGGCVIASSDADHIPKGKQLATAFAGDYEIVSYAGREYFAKTCRAQDYQGYGGPGWLGHVMIPCASAFRQHHAASLAGIEAATMRGIMGYADTFCPPLHAVVRGAEQINLALRRVIWNGQIMCAGDDQDLLRLKAVLLEISQASDDTSRVFHDSIEDLYATVVSSSLQDIQAVSRLLIDIMDRSLYERANDCRWWALTPDIRRLMAQPGGAAADRQPISPILESINQLYTAYTRLVVFDADGVIVAASDPQRDGLETIGQPIDPALVRKTLALRDTQAYCVSPFEATWLYGGRPTYVYCAAVRHPDDASRVVGGIGIVFDAETELRNMLASCLPGRAGAFAAFADRQGRVVSSTHPGYPPGSLLRPDAAIFTQQNGVSGATVAVHDGDYTMLGHTTSFGYREYKNSGDYDNDVIAMVCVPIGAALSATAAGGGRQAAAASAGERTQRDGQAQEFALFSMNEGLFALAASDVVEAIDAAKLRRTAVLPTPLAGMVNFTLAGSDTSVLVPVIDMRQVMQGGAPQQPPQTEVIVVRNGARMFGMLVETLGDVLNFDSDQIEPAPRMVQGEAGYVRHIIKTGAHDQMIQVLDVARIGQLFNAV